MWSLRRCIVLMSPHLRVSPNCYSNSIMVLISYTWRMLLSPVFTVLVSHIIMVRRPAACPPLAVLLDPHIFIWMGKKRCSATLGICTKTAPLMCRTWGCLIPSDCRLLKYKLSAHCAESLLFWLIGSKFQALSTAHLHSRILTGLSIVKIRIWVILLK